MTTPSGPDPIEHLILTILARTGRRMSATAIGEQATENGRLLIPRIGDINRACKNLTDRGLTEATRPYHPESGRRLARRFRITAAGTDHLAHLGIQRYAAWLQARQRRTADPGVHPLTQEVTA